MACTEAENFGGSAIRSGRMLVRKREMEMHLEAARRRTRGGRLLRLGLTAIGLFLVLSLLAPGRAGAGTYRVLECHPPTSSTAPDARTTGNVDGYTILLGIDCNGWGVWVRGWNPTGSTWGRVYVEAPPTTKFKNVVMSYRRGAFAGWNSAIYVMRGETVVYPPSQPSPYTGSWNLPNVDATRIAADVSCPPPGYSFCLTFDGDFDNAGFKNLDLLLVDSERPDVGLGGPALDGPTAHGLSQLRIDASDRGGGVRTVTVDVNGQSVASPPIGCAIAPGGSYATQVRPCADFHSSVRLDTERPPFREGQNTLQVCATDVSTEGDAHQQCAQRTIVVDNSCPDSSGAGGEAHSLNAGLENPRTGELRRTRSVRSTEGVSVRGSLAGPGGAVRGASVCVYETVDEPAGIAQLVQVAKSKTDGTFAAHLPPGPSRVFEVAYRYGDRQIESPTMYLDSSVKPVFKVTRKSLRNGSSVGFRGRLPGPNAGGRSVTLQARVGRKWRTFKQLQSNPRGRFKGKYRFTQTRGAVFYVFRALVKKQGGYPYSAGASRKAKVLVRG
jgi:hypothetical protein